MGEDTVTYRFKNEAGQAVKNVEVRGYTCNDINCNTVNTNYWSYSGNTGNSNTVTLVFPTSLPPSQRYALYFFAQEYIYKKFPVYWYGNDNEGIKDKIFQKTDNPCKADVSYINAINKIGEWLPLTIQTDTSLDSSTSAAIQFNNIAPFYKPWLTDTSLNQYMKLQTLISVNIREAGASQSIFSDSVTKNLLTNANSQNSFTWSTTQGHPGNYTITLTSHITDTKCSSVIDDSRSSQVEAFPSLPDGFGGVESGAY